MPHENEKNVLVHWYYSVSEWESFITCEKNKAYYCFLKGFVIGGVITFPVVWYGINTLWIIALAVSCVIAALFGFCCYSISRYRMKWKQPQPPEIIITTDQASVNGKLTIFNGGDKFFRKAEIKEKHDRNVLEIVYESNTGEKISFDELIIPVPKGKLREAIVLLDSLNYPRSAWSLFA
jgi:hypothetical protein